MVRRLSLTCIALAFFVAPGLVFGQPRSTEVDFLRKEIELLKRELDLLKRENELLKRENESLKKGGGSTKSADPMPEPPPTVTVDDVEYVYQGSVRSGTKLTVTVLATSKDGIKPGPNGSMVIIDDKGNKFTGLPVGGFGVQPMLREGIPVKLSWNFGAPNPFTGAATNPAPSAKITRFAGVIINRTVGGGGETIDFRNVPAVLPPPPKTK